MKKEILVAISVAGVLFGLSVSLAAQEKLSLAQCREMALKYNKDMAAANKQTEAARLMSLSYKANFFPNFTVNGTGIYSTADGSLGVPGGNLPVFLPNPATGELVSSGFAYFPGLNLDYKVGTVYSGGIQVEQPLYMGGKIRAAYKMSLLGKEMAHLNEALTTSEVILNTDKAYVQLVKAKEMRKVAEKYHNLLTELFKNVKSAHRHGMKPQNDVLKVQVKLNESELSLRKADNALRLAGMNLCHYIGRPLTAQIDISDDFPEVEQEWKVQVSDITARPEYGILNKQIAIAEQEVKLNRSELLPRIVVIFATLLILQPIDWAKLIYALCNPDYVAGESLARYYFGIAFDVQKNGTFLETIRMNMWEGQLANMTWALEHGRILQTPGLFLFGMLIGRRKYFLYSEQNERLWLKALAIALLCFFPIYGLNNMLPEFIERSAILVPLQLILSSFSSLSFMVLLVTGLLLTFYHVKDRSFFMRFTSYGKMSLTNYLGQSIFGSLLFYHWGFELGRYLGITYSFFFGILFVILQMVFCSWWLRHHKHGPFEGLWKRLTWIGKNK